MCVFIVKKGRPYEQSNYFYFSTYEKALDFFFENIGDYWFDKGFFCRWEYIDLYSVETDSINQKRKYYESFEIPETYWISQFCSETSTYEQSENSQIETGLQPKGVET